MGVGPAVTTTNGRSSRRTGNAWFRHCFVQAGFRLWDMPPGECVPRLPVALASPWRCRGAAPNPWLQQAQSHRLGMHGTLADLGARFHDNPALFKAVAEHSSLLIFCSATRPDVCRPPALHGPNTLSDVPGRRVQQRVGRGSRCLSLAPFLRLYGLWLEYRLRLRDGFRDSRWRIMRPRLPGPTGRRGRSRKPPR
jgi:hypothetical protein